MFFDTYILQSDKDKENYIGYSKDLRKRLTEHNLGQNISPKHRRPPRLIYYEACMSELDATQREKYLKTTAGRKFLARRLRHFRVSQLASKAKLL